MAHRQKHIRSSLRGPSVALTIAAALAVSSAFIAPSPTRANEEEISRFRLADWEVEALIARPPLDWVKPLAPADFGLAAFPPATVVAAPAAPVTPVAPAAAAEAPTAVVAATPPAAPAADEPSPGVLAPSGPEELPSLAELAADPPSLVENGKPDPAITATRVAGALRAILARETRSGAALAGFYASRQFQPLFTADGLLSARGLAAANRMTQAGNDGLDPQAYRVALPEGPRTAERIAELELALARAVALYAYHASGGRTDARRLSANFDVAPPRIDAVTALSQVAAAADMAAALDGFNPPHEGFRRLRAKLAEIRADNRVAAREMSDTSATRRAIGLERDIIANLERWRWLPRELGEAHIWVNVPDYDAAIVSDGRVIHRTKTIVGRHETQTPVFSHSMSYIVFNPAWYVPHSIVRRDMVANATRDPSYFARRGIEVVRRGRVVDPATIDWSATNVGNLGFRQPPGERNALGRMKFMFPNAHAIYLHDTPNRSLFSREARAFSNGCIRVFEPERFAEVVLGLAMPGENWTQARIDTLYGPGERTVRFKRNVPIHLVYFTMDVDASGQLVQHADIYGHNARVRAALIGQRS